MFWAYLWGIETDGHSLFLCHLYLVLSLPMRNWNLGLLDKNIMLPYSFEPTYEELKLHSQSGISYSPMGFEPTYEELKRPKQCEANRKRPSFEPTYEELKLIFTL